MLAPFGWTRRRLPAGHPGPSCRVGILGIHGRLPAALFGIHRRAVAVYQGGVWGCSRDLIWIVAGRCIRRVGIRASSSASAVEPSSHPALGPLPGTAVRHLGNKCCRCSSARAPGRIVRGVHLALSGGPSCSRKQRGQPFMYSALRPSCCSLLQPFRSQLRPRCYRPLRHRPRPGLWH